MPPKRKSAAAGHDQTTGSSVSKRRRRETEADKNDGDHPNADICEMLLEMADTEKHTQQSLWPVLAYRKAAQILSEQDHRVQNGEEAQKLPGVGKEISARIDEFLNSGSVQKIEDAKNDEGSKAVAELSRVPGIGYAHAKRLMSEGISSIDDLRKHEDKLTDAQRVALRHLDDIEKPIPRARVKQIGEKMEDDLKKLHKDFELTLCGAYRRGDETITEVVAVITHKSRVPDGPLMMEVTDALKKSGIFVEIITEGEHDLKAVISLSGSHSKTDGDADEDRHSDGESNQKPKTSGRGSKFPAKKKSPAKNAKKSNADGQKADGGGGNHFLSLHVYPESQYYPAILHWTGNDLFVQELNSKAKAEGYLLNQYGLHWDRKEDDDKSEGDAVNVRSEKDIFKAIGMDYVPPEERNVA